MYQLHNSSAQNSSCNTRVHVLQLIYNLESLLLQIPRLPWASEHPHSQEPVAGHYNIAHIWSHDDTLDLWMTCLLSWSCTWSLNGIWTLDHVPDLWMALELLIMHLISEKHLIFCWYTSSLTDNSDFWWTPSMDYIIDCLIIYLMMLLTSEWHIWSLDDIVINNNCSLYGMLYLWITYLTT